ncbi:MAG: DMT family transporter [Pseudomonadota bacterium]
MTNVSTASGPQNTLLGIAFMCMAVSLFPIQNAIVKYLSADYALTQLVWVRFAGHLALINLFFLPTFGRRLYATSEPSLQLLRSFLMLGAVGFFVWGISYLPLAFASAIGFLCPIAVTALSVPLLSERVGWRRWLAVGAGLIGALIIIRPSVGTTHWAVWLLLANVACYSLYTILTRKVSRSDPPAVSIAYTALAGTVVMTCLVPFVWRAPESLWHMALFVALGGLGGISHFFVIRALQNGPASVISPLGYLELIGTTALGFFIFHTLPDAWTFVGAAVVAMSGLYIAYRERIRARDAVVQVESAPASSTAPDDAVIEATFSRETNATSPTPSPKKVA